MERTLRTIAIFLLFLQGALLAIGQDNGASVALTPPMGWNSWDSFSQSIDEAAVKQTAEAMSKELKQYGWEYVVIDEGWYVANPLDDPQQFRLLMTEDGRYIPDAARFPSAKNDAGFKALADHVHSLGLKFGIHILRGIPRVAVESDLPIADSNFRASSAADKSDMCPWNSYNFGVKDNAAGQAYYDSILKQYAGWGVDFLKVDCIANNPYKPDEIRMIAEAIRKAGRPMVLSLSPGPTAIEHAEEVAKYAEMWRTCNDFWDHWGKWKGQEWSQGLFDQFKTAAEWAPKIKEGHWPDSDMLPLGWLGPKAGAGKTRTTSLTRDEQQTMMTLWSMARSPLMMGGNLLKLDDWTRRLLTNREVIEVDQQSRDNREALREGDTVIWLARPKDGKGYFVAVFNVGETELKVDRSWIDAGVPGKKHRRRDLWSGKDMGQSDRLKVKLRPHASVLWRVE